MKHFVFRFVLLVILFLSGIMAYNYHYDTSGLFNTDFSIYRVEPNQHFVKIRYLLENPEKYNAYCFGSSRVGKIDLTKTGSGYHYYNMTYSQGLPEEWLDDVQLFLAHHVKIRQIIIGIDDFSFKVDPKTHESQYLRIPYHDNGNLKTYLSYLLKEPSLPIDPGEKGCIFDIYNTGRPLPGNADKKIELNVEKHINDEKFNKPCHYVGNRMCETIDSLQKLKNLCNENNIELIVFINPIHKTTYLDNDLTQFNEFKRQLSNVTDYYDFSGLNEITTSNYYYYETSHYRPLVGDMIIQRIFQPEKGTTFGVYVTKENVEEYLRALENEVSQ